MATDNDGTITSYSWSFPGGSPVSATVEDPGQVTYDEIGSYLTSFSATDNSGASCDAVSINVTVLEPATYTIGGSVSGLEGSGLVLQNNAGDDLAITANGDFTFLTAIDDGSSYDITVLNQPDGPGEICSVTNNNGLVSGENVSDVGVTCSSDDLIFKDSFE